MEKLILGGAWVQVRIEDDDGIKNIGLASGVSYNEDFKVSGAQVLGYLGDVTQDSHGYSCSLTMQTYLPNRKKPDFSGFRDGGQTTYHDITASRDEVQKLGTGKKFKRILLVNRSTEEVAEQFQEPIVMSQGAQINPGDYARGNVQFLCIKRITE